MNRNSGLLAQKPFNFENLVILTDDSYTPKSCGFILDPSGTILATTHGVNEVKYKAGEVWRVHIIIPVLGFGHSYQTSASVNAQLLKDEHDVTLLKIDEEISNTINRFIPKFRSGETQIRASFLTKGYPNIRSKLDGYTVSGVINGSSRVAYDKSFAVTELLLSTSDSISIDKGFSGSPIYCPDIDSIVGIISRGEQLGRRLPDGTTIPIALDITILEKLGYVHLLEVSQSTPSAPVSIWQQNEVEIISPETHFLKHAPTIHSELVDRSNKFKDVLSFCSSSDLRMLYVFGIAGIGKSIALRQMLSKYIDSSTADSTNPLIFWWRFRLEHNLTFFLNSLLHWLYPTSAAAIDQLGVEYKLDLLRRNSSKIQAIIVLDDIDALYDVIASESADEASLFFEIVRCFIRESSTCKLILVSRIVYNFINALCGSIKYIEIPAFTAENTQLLFKKCDITIDKQTVRYLHKQWHGHPLALSLIANYIRVFHSGLWSVTDVLPENFSEGNEFENIMQQYDSHLSILDKAFLEFFSLSRIGLTADAFQKTIIRKSNQLIFLDINLKSDSEYEFKRLISKLTRYGLIWIDSQDLNRYISHPLIREYYVNKIRTYNTKKERERKYKIAHLALADYYTNKCMRADCRRTYSEILNCVESIYHYQSVDMLRYAGDIYFNKIKNGDQRLLTRIYADYFTDIELIKGFFNSGNINDTLKLREGWQRAFVYKELASTLWYLADLSGATACYIKAIGELNRANFKTQCILASIELAEVLAYNGRIAESSELLWGAEKLFKETTNGDIEIDIQKWGQSNKLVRELRGLSVREISRYRKSLGMIINANKYWVSSILQSQTHCTPPKELLIEEKELCIENRHYARTLSCYLDIEYSAYYGVIARSVDDWIIQCQQNGYFEAECLLRFKNIVFIKDKYCEENQDEICSVLEIAREKSRCELLLDLLYYAAMYYLKNEKSELFLQVMNEAIPLCEEKHFQLHNAKFHYLMSLYAEIHNNLALQSSHLNKFNALVASMKILPQGISIQIKRYMNG